eukprot:TRINITY_DN2580_c0_g1_i10.p1 TRINITY_DN2580_c0_g1~~TRINITY_DN2580_c0_g1_i10.p1  ORF type:complete len:115 (-),score=27.57 TRINITY_DN2580_c0_g1_i10:170-514(-)
MFQEYIGKRRLQFYERVFITDHLKRRKQPWTASTHILREKIEANRLGVILRTRTVEDPTRISGNCFQSLKGSKRERCQRNLVKISMAKEMLEKNKGNYERSMNIAFAVNDECKT